VASGTTNLYGLSDRVAELRARCDRLGIPLIEDAAHAIQTEVDGRPIGSFGAAAAFSLSKHARAGGGGPGRYRPRLPIDDGLVGPPRTGRAASLPQSPPTFASV
jgi:DegT/DnrJ/EryC1/StrS aminotransferase family